MLLATNIVKLGYVTQALELYTILWDRGKTIMYNIKKISLMFLVTLLLEVLLTGCANLRVGLMLLQHATGPYDPMDRVMEDRLNAILEAVVAQDAAAVKAQFAPNAIAVQPELDSQIEALFDYYDSENGEIDNISGRAGSASDGAGGKNRYYEMSGKIVSGEMYLVYIRAITEDTNDPDNVGVWALLLRRKADEADYPDGLSYHVKGEEDMIGVYVGLPAYRFDLGLPTE